MASDREVVLQIDPTPAHELLAGDGGPVLVDIREPWELEQGRIAGSVHIPMAELDEKLEPYRERSIVLYCAHGNRSLRAAKAFSEQGYREVVSLAGGHRRVGQGRASRSTSRTASTKPSWRATAATC